ncbi:MAG: glycosyltransferase [Steroidobacteraceae bacterium]
MHALGIGLAALPLIVWTYLIAARGGFWVEPLRLSPAARRSGPPPAGGGAPRRIVAVIPARDEADVIGAAVESLLRQEMPGSLHIIVVDDGSSDGTAAAVTRAAGSVGAPARLSVISGAPPPAGWTGKLWAMSQGVAASARLSPDYLLFTDADIHHDPGSVGALVASAEAGGRDLASLMVRLSAETFAERALIPAFVFFFFLLYPPAWIASPRRRTAGAAGGCMLIRPQALARCGGLAAIRSAIIDDCALAAAVKGSGGSVSLALTRGARSLRPYGSFAEIGRMISRTAFNQLRHSYGLLTLTLVGLVVTYGLAPLLLLTGRPLPMLLGATAWALMTLAYRPIVRFYGLGILWSLTLPAAAAFYCGATLHSAIAYRRGRGGMWKGRAQDVEI